MKLRKEGGSWNGWHRTAWMVMLIGAVAGCRTIAPEPTMRPVFDQASLVAWGCLSGGSGAFEFQDDILSSRPGREGRLFTVREYGDFILRFEYQGEAGASVQLALRTASTADPLIMGIPIQLGPVGQGTGGDASGVHGMVAGFAGQTGGFLRGSEKWNEHRILCQGRRLRSFLNGRLIQDIDFNQHPRPEIFLNRPGLLNEKGQIGLVTHGGWVKLRAVTIQELPRPYLVNMAPDGFQSLFDGRSLRNWEGLWGDPPARASMREGDAKLARVRADHVMTRNWMVRDGVLFYRGNGFDNICTRQQFANFELLLEWQIREGADSGVYLRGCPQVQIWDRESGSGGLFNNEVHASQPLKRADRYPGSWNRFRILMVGERVTVMLNDELVVHNVVMENYWDRSQPVYARGPVELQAHETPVAFRNIAIRELP